jgi:hypothetical protein
VKEVNGLQIFHREDVKNHIERLRIIYENKRLGLIDKANIKP